ncbi:hypothetical protein ACF068_31240 [Streptomyces sp. NPDC016309]|uniref:hypothetical protein n=1 Tax=Streptomyces sp. NPDC016309 TaxID=3364965 RepID=UPI0036FF0EC3
MDLSDVIERAELHQELAARVGTVPPTGRKPRLEGQWQAAWRMFETACQFYGSARPEALVSAMRRAHDAFTANRISSPGFLWYAFRELAPEVDVCELPMRTEWAARAMEAVRAGLRDEAFATWLVALDEALEALASETELVNAS